MANFVHIFLLTIVLGLLPNLATAQTPLFLETFINKLDTDKDALQGGMISVLYKGEVVYKKTFGYRHGNVGPIESSTLFPLASVSKAVSATAIALFVERGLLDFDDSFKLSPLKHKVTLDQLLSHRTGYEFKGNAQIEQGVSRLKLLEILRKQKPSCTPGKCYTYSNMVFSLVEEALNTKDLSMKEAIHNLKTTLKIQGIQIMPIPNGTKVAFPHQKNIKSPMPFPPYYPKITPASAGIFASLDAMIEFFKLSFGYRNDLISQKTLDRLFTTQLLNKEIDKWNIKIPKSIQSYYGLGWRVLKDPLHPNMELIFHSGFIGGATSFIGFIPAEEVGLIMAVNEQSKFPLSSGLELWKIILNKSKKQG